jgi:hypothetical protein
VNGEGERQVNSNQGQSTTLYFHPHSTSPSIFAPAAATTLRSLADMSVYEGDDDDHYDISNARADHNSDRDSDREIYMIPSDRDNNREVYMIPSLARDRTTIPQTNVGQSTVSINNGSDSADSSATTTTVFVTPKKTTGGLTCGSRRRSVGGGGPRGGFTSATPI